MFNDGIIKGWVFAGIPDLLESEDILLANYRTTWRRYAITFEDGDGHAMTISFPKSMIKDLRKACGERGNKILDIITKKR